IPSVDSCHDIRTSNSVAHARRPARRRQGPNRLGIIVQDKNVSSVPRTQLQHSRFTRASNIFARIAVLALCAAVPVVTAAPAKPQLDLRALLLKLAPSAPQAAASVAPRELRLNWT